MLKTQNKLSARRYRSDHPARKSQMPPWATSSIFGREKTPLSVGVATACFGVFKHLPKLYHPAPAENRTAEKYVWLAYSQGVDLGNIESLIQTSLASFKNAVWNPFTFDAQDGTFRDSEGRVSDDRAIQLVADKPGQARPGNAGSTTYKRGAVLSALLRQQSQESRAGGSGVGILGRILENGRQFPASSKGIFYSKSSGHT